MMKKEGEQKFAFCVRNDDCEDLEPRKVYQVLPDKRAESEGYLRIVDDSGEDYLYPESYFVFVKLPKSRFAHCSPIAQFACIAAVALRNHRRNHVHISFF